MVGTMKSSPEIFADWSLYDKVIELNYMRHREMALAIDSCARKLPQPLHVLDLGCGDGRMAGQGLRNCDVVSYCGVDLSDAALKSARQHVRELNCQVSFVASDLQEALCGTITPRPNLVLASYSLHHYQPETTARLIGRVGAILAAGGTLIWIDLERGNDESRDRYLERFTKQRVPEWAAMTPQDKQEIADHMSTSDFPLSADERREIARAAGLAWLATPYSDADYTAEVYQVPRDNEP